MERITLRRVNSVTCWSTSDSTMSIGSHSTSLTMTVLEDLVTKNSVRQHPSCKNGALIWATLRLSGKIVMLMVTAKFCSMNSVPGQLEIASILKMMMMSTMATWLPWTSIVRDKTKPTLSNTLIRRKIVERHVDVVKTWKKKLKKLHLIKEVFQTQDHQLLSKWWPNLDLTKAPSYR